MKGGGNVKFNLNNCRRSIEKLRLFAITNDEKTVIAYFFVLSTFLIRLFFKKR